MSGKAYYPDGASYQSGINMTGWHAGMFKATEGTSYVNPAYHEQKAEVARVGGMFGAYHFLLRGNGRGQADHAFDVVGKDVPLMIDAEPEASSNPVLADIREFCDQYRTRGGIVHLLYFPRWYWQQLGSPDLSSLASRGLHLVTSDYSGNPEDPNGPGWATYGGMPPVYTWQYTSTGTVNGMHNVDLNCFRGSGSSTLNQTLTEMWCLWRTGTLNGSAHPQPPADWTEQAIMALPTLAEGAVDAAGSMLMVHRVQNDVTGIGRWNALGPVTALTDDGVFGPATTAGVRAIQSFFGLTQDGIVGPDTWRKLIGA